jgi:hypothetical protein
MQHDEKLGPTKLRMSSRLMGLDGTTNLKFIMVRPQGIEGSGMAGPGGTLGSPWLPHGHTGLVPSAHLETKVKSFEGLIIFPDHPCLASVHPPPALAGRHLLTGHCLS